MVWGEGGWGESVQQKAAVLKKFQHDPMSTPIVKASSNHQLNVVDNGRKRFSKVSNFKASQCCATPLPILSLPNASVTKDIFHNTFYFLCLMQIHYTFKTM